MNKMFRLLILLLSVSFAVCVYGQRIAVLSDLHVTPGNQNETALRNVVNEINSLSFDLVVVSGDLTNEGSDVELNNIKSILDSINSPLFVIPGNHETNWSQSATKTFNDLWGNDRFVTKVDSLLIVGINCGPYMKMGDGHIKQEDLHWLRSTLQSELQAGMKVLSINHYPLLDDLDNCADYIQVLEDFPVIGHLNGHYHSWRYYPAGGQEAGGDLPAAMLRALQMGNENFGYSIVDVDNDWIHIYDKELNKTAKAMFAWPVRTQHKKINRTERPEIVAPESYVVEKVWTDSASIFTRIGFDEDRFFFGNSLGQARAVDKLSGELLWSIPTGASLFSRPVSLGRNRVAVPAHDGILILDATNGNLRVKRNSEEGPYVADGTLTRDAKGYIQGGYKRIERRRPTDGKLVWKYDSLFNYCQAAPAIEGSDLIFGAWDTNLRCVDVNTGRLKWVWNNGRSANMLGPGNVVPVICGERVYIVAPDRYMTAIDRTTGQQIWRDNSHKYRESIGCSMDRTRVYAKTMDGELVAIDATSTDFRELWTVDMGLGYEHAPCIVVEHDGVVFAGSRRGKLALVDPENASLITVLPLGVSEINGIDVDPTTGHIYVSLIEGTIFRIYRR